MQVVHLLPRAVANCGVFRFGLSIASEGSYRKEPLSRIAVDTAPPELPFDEQPARPGDGSIWPPGLGRPCLLPRFKRLVMAPKPGFFLLLAIGVGAAADEAGSEIPEATGRIKCKAKPG